MTDFQASPFQHQVEGDKDIIGALERRGDHAVELIARRDELDLRLTREFRNGFSGIFGRYVELPDLGGGGRACTCRRNRYCSVDPRTFAPNFQARSCLLHPSGGCTPSLDTRPDDERETSFPYGFCF